MRCNIQLCEECAGLLRKIQTTSSEQQMANALGAVILNCAACRQQLPAELIAQLEAGARMEVGVYCRAEAPVVSALQPAAHTCVCCRRRHADTEHECHCGRSWFQKEGP